MFLCLRGENDNPSVRIQHFNHIFQTADELTVPFHFIFMNYSKHIYILFRISFEFASNATVDGQQVEIQNFIYLTELINKLVYIFSDSEH